MMENIINRYEGKTVAVTGASGYLAAVLIAALQKTPAHILRVSRQDLPPISGTERLKADICIGDCWEKIVSKADIIFHLAGNTSVYAAAENPANSLNSTVLPITHLVDAAQASGHERRVVFASTATVYGLTEDLPVAEDAELKPITNYDLHKLCAEMQLELAAKQGIIDGVSLRLANVYGPSSSASSASNRGILNKITRIALQGGNLKIYGDGNYLRDYVYVDDVARAFIVTGVGKGVTGRSYNVASGRGVTVQEVFCLVAERAGRVLGRNIKAEHCPWPGDVDPIEARNFVANIHRISTTFDWQPTVFLEAGIDRLIDALTSH